LALFRIEIGDSSVQRQIGVSARAETHDAFHRDVGGTAEASEDIPE